jgi:signal transduction histidine kinase
VALRLELPESLPAIRMDPDRLLQVLTNLLSNAAKFTSRGTVTLAGEAVDIGVRLRVADTGPGIDAKDLGRIFEKFYQVQSDTLAHTAKGSGMGLAICRQIVEHYGGRIWAESTPGRGSVFTLELPAED